MTSKLVYTCDGCGKTYTESFTSINCYGYPDALREVLGFAPNDAHACSTPCIGRVARKISNAVDALLIRGGTEPK